MPLFAARRAVSRRLAAVKIEQAAFEVEKWRAQKLTCQRIDSNVTAHRIELTSKFRILDYFCLVFSSEVFQLLLEDCALLFQLHTISCLRRRKKKMCKTSDQFSLFMKNLISNFASNSLMHKWSVVFYKLKSAT